MDYSLSAIEEQLRVAQANAGRPAAAEALAKAQIFATLWAGSQTPTLTEAKPPLSHDGLPVAEPDGMLIGDPTDDDFFAEAKAARKKK